MISRRTFFALAWAAPLAAGTKKYCGIRFRSISKGQSPRRYFWIHGDETTARDALTAHMQRFRGRALLVDNPTRVIKAGAMEFDPNRMFTEAGLERNLVRLNPEASEAERRRIHKLVARDREKLLRELTPPMNGLLTVVHNNSRGYSVNDEVEISNQISIPAPGEPSDFMLCTNPNDFELLRRSPFNAVLQNEPKGEEDGSLSRLAAARKIRYVNIEVARGRDAAQRAMLEWLETNLP
ncbi:MAG: hypothetical protein ACKV2U_01815 [Bryobacteraceae bacterium]